jgi:hypothetical protein
MGMLLMFGKKAVIRPVITGIGYHLAERRYYLTGRVGMDEEDCEAVRSIATGEGWECVGEEPKICDECRASAREAKAAAAD